MRIFQINMTNSTCINITHLTPIYNEILGCTIMVIVLSILIFCKLLKKYLINLYKGSKNHLNNNGMPRLHNQSV